MINKKISMEYTKWEFVQVKKAMADYVKKECAFADDDFMETFHLINLYHKISHRFKAWRDTDEKERAAELAKELKS